MQRIIVLDSDDKTRQSIINWVYGYNSQIKVDSFSSEKQFNEKYFSKKENLNEDSDLQNTKENQEEAEQLHIDLILFDLEISSFKPIEWIKKCTVKLNQNNLHPPEFKTKFVVLSFPDHNLNIEKLANKYIDDLFFKILDKELTLQKIELLLSKNFKTSSILYTQKIEFSGEIGKKTKLAGLSELGFLIKNPIPLKNGTFIKAYLSYASHIPPILVTARCFKNTKKNPTDEEYLCHFSFFGITNNQLKNIRNFINQRDKSIVLSKTYNVDLKKVLSLTNKHNIIIIDMDADLNKSLIEIISQSNLSQYFSFFSLNQFLKTIQKSNNNSNTSIFNKNNNTEANQANVKNLSTLNNDNDEDFAYNSSLKIQLSPDVFHIDSILPPPRSNSLILGYEYQDLINNTISLKTLIKDEEKEKFEEFLDYIRSGQSAEVIITFVNKNKNEFQRKITALPRKKDNKIMYFTLNINKVKDSSITNITEIKNIRSIDLIILNGIFVPTNIEDWLKNFKKTINKHLNIQNSLEDLQFMVIGEEDSKINPKKFLKKDFLIYLNKPVDRRFFKQTILFLFPQLYLQQNEEDIYQIEIDKKIIITQEIQVKQISEFGVMINYVNSISTNTSVYLFFPIFEEINEEGILARCYLCEENPMEGYDCYFYFFGITDFFLKRIRSWIKENYVASKDGM